MGETSAHCPHCDQIAHKMISPFAIGGRASAGRALSSMPQTWVSTRGGDREYVTSLRREADRRAALESRHGELSAATRRVVAHEGRYAHAPLFEGEDPRADTPHHHVRTLTSTGEQI